MKKWHQSKTIWFGVLTLVLSLLTATQGQEIIQNNPTVISLIGMSIGVITIILRAISNKGIE